MDAGTAAAAELLGDEVAIDPNARRASTVDVDDATLAIVERCLEDVRDDVASFFAVALGTREGAGLLRYEPGGFYGTHRDRADNAAWPEAARRRIAIVWFLNSSCHVHDQGDFSGGVLRLHVSSEDVIDVHPEAGTVVAFPADTIHEVTVVRDGTRDAVVDWFY